MLLPMINQKFLNLQEDIENRKNPDKSDQNTNFQNFSQDLMQNEVDDDGGPMSMFAVKKLEDLFTVEKIMCLRFRGDLYRYQTSIWRVLQNQFLSCDMLEIGFESCGILLRSAEFNRICNENRGRSDIRFQR
eukprot:403351765